MSSIGGLGGFVPIEPSPSPFIGGFLTTIPPYRNTLLLQEAQKVTEAIQAKTRDLTAATTCLGVLEQAAAADTAMVANLNNALMKLGPPAQPISADAPAKGIIKAMDAVKATIEQLRSSLQPGGDMQAALANRGLNLKLAGAGEVLRMLETSLQAHGQRINEVNAALANSGLLVPGLGVAPPSPRPGDTIDIAVGQPPTGDTTPNTPITQIDMDAATTDSTGPPIEKPGVEVAPPPKPPSYLSAFAGRAELAKVAEALKGMVVKLNEGLRQDMAQLVVIEAKRRDVFSVINDALQRLRNGR